MAITIQELLASDTISQVVDKINFNFDQLLLNGGGPVGPAGPLGPPGPIGGRGERGTEWYEGTADPNVVPPTLTPLTADYYLQSNGDVWEFTGLTWTNTGINLVGPAGPSGASVGWSQFGNNPYPNYAATYQNVLYPAPITTGITVSNQGVAATLIGAVGPGDVSANPGIPFTPAFQLNNTMAGSIDASVVSMLVHQKDSSASAIKFMGGGAVAADNYEQSALANLSSIGLGIDDSIVINVPKSVTGTIGSLQDTYGFNLYTLQKGQSFRAGRSISFTTGTLGPTLTGPLDVSDFTINLNVVNSSKLPKYEMNILGSKDASISAGNVTLPVATLKEGSIVLDSGKVKLIAKDLVNIESLSGEWNFPGLQSVPITPAGLLGISSSGKLGTLSTGGSFSPGILGWNGTSLTSDTGTNNRIVRWDGTAGIQSSTWEIQDTGALVAMSGNKFIGDDGSGIERIYFDGNVDNRIALEDVPTGVSGLSNRIQIYVENTGNEARGLTVTQNGVFVGYGKTGTGLSMINSESVMSIKPIGSGSAATASWIEFGTPGSATATSPTIIGPVAGSSAPASRDMLTIKGGSGNSLATGFGLSGIGRQVAILGGDATALQSGGDVYISGGIKASAISSNGRVILGYEPYGSTYQYSSHVNFGDSSGSSRGWVYIKQPADADIPITAQSYTLAVSSNHSSVQGDARNGAVKFTNSTDDKAIEFHTQVGTDDYSPLSNDNDNIIINRGTATAAGTNGLVIAPKSRPVGIRMDADDDKLQLLSYGVNEATNYNGQQFTWYAEGNIHIDHTSAITPPSTPLYASNPERTRGIFASGEFGPSNTITGGGSITGQWIRVGRNVTFSGTATTSGSNATQRIWPLPLKPSSGNITVLHGSGTLFSGAGGSYAFRMMPVEAFAAGTNGLAFKWGSGIWVGNPYASTVSNNGSGVRFTIQYMLP